MTGDQSDIIGRLRALLPARWFPDQAPVLNTVLAGLGSAWAWLYSMVQFARAQTRIATATDVWLDMISSDLFGDTLGRRVAESDASFRQRIQAEVLRPRGTREAMMKLLVDLSGRSPKIFEPARPTDTGGYGGISGKAFGFAYGQAGGWGSLQLPFQSFIVAYRAASSGISQVNGWGQPAGGYGIGSIEYGGLDMIEGQLTDQAIYSSIARCLPVASTAWVSLQN